MKVREHIRVDGLPFTWSTNLDDAGLRTFYARYADRLTEPEPPPDPSAVIIRTPLRIAFLEFLGGICLWTATGANHTVLYRSHRDLELWNARQAEIEELRQEQATEMAAQRQLLLAEDNHLKEKTDLAFEARNYDAAAAHIFARAELRLQCTEPYRMPGVWSLWCSDFPCLFARFPTSDFGMNFLRKYDMRPQAWTNLAHWYEACRRAARQDFEAETARIYTQACALFPDNPRVWKAACLFWRRQHRYELAIDICAQAIAKGLRDGTKSGFEGRLQRLEREMKSAKSARTTG